MKHAYLYSCTIFRFLFFLSTENSGQTAGNEGATGSTGYVDFGPTNEIDDTQSQQIENVINVSNTSSEPCFGFEPPCELPKEVDMGFSFEYGYFTDVGFRNFDLEIISINIIDFKYFLAERRQSILSSG